MTADNCRRAKRPFAATHAGCERELYRHGERLTRRLARAGSGMDKVFGGWERAGYGEPSYDVAYGPDRTTLTLPLVSSDSTGDSTAEGRPKAVETGCRVRRQR